MDNWFPLINFTHYSLLKGFSKPSELVEKCKQNNYPACGICDFKTISGAVSFYKSCKDANIKPIIGCAFDDFVVFAKNKDGWHDLIALVSSLDDDDKLDTSTANKIIAKNNLVKLTKDDIKKSPVSYYTNKEQANLHRVLLCSHLKTTLPKVMKQIKKDPVLRDDNGMDLSQYFISDKFYVLSADESKGLDISLAKKLYEQCEDYNILSKPNLPEFSCPNNKSEEDYLKELCRIGWKNLLQSAGKVEKEDDKNKYLNRFKIEFDVIKNANLFGYFLIVKDIIRYAESKGWLCGPGRGSAAGCLISYLIGITKIDPVEYDLLFERFYNAGRNSEDRVSLPDIDMDFPGNHRDDIIEYLKNKYGHDNVSQMITFGRLQGRSALKEVLRVNEACSFAEMNAITKSVPNEAEISDQLAEMDDDERSIIRWALINRAEDLQDFCSLNEEGKLDGNYAEFFQQAIDLEGTFKTQGKHAAGVVISKAKLSTVCPMVKPRGDGEKIAGLEMSDLEALGHVKFDVLGITLLDKLMYIKELV